ncbi:MAG: right-handed parallel beta-helix repeat-containing protein [Alphaproteobacteria bacterium]|nr:right-handed parallel beta-helix repeat-containing protein [Alphaproteobacteria bacterium]
MDRPRRRAAMFKALLGIGAMATMTGIMASAGATCPADAIRVPVGASLQAQAERAGPNAVFCIEAGVHRMQTVRALPGQRFYGEPGSVLNGAQVLTDFKREGAFWTTASVRLDPTRRGECLRGRESCAVAHGFFIDNKPLVQVLREGDVAANRFFVDFPAGRIKFADDPRGKLVELATAIFAVHGRAPNILVSGLAIEKYRNPPQEGAVQGEEAEGWKIVDSEFRFNRGAGVSVGDNGAITGCDIHHNGQQGATAGGTNILVENNTIWENNIYGFDPEWEAGGVKITESERIVFRGNRVFRNGGPGLWCDESCRDVLFERNTVEHNTGPGIFFEISFRATIRGNTLRENGRGQPTWFWGADIQIAASEFVDVYENTVTVRPGGRAIMLIDQNRRIAAGGYYKTRSNRVYRNDVTFLGDGAAGGASDARRGAENFGIIQSSGNAFDQNTYRYSGARAPRFVWGEGAVDFEGFRRAGQERSGALMPAPVN